MAWWKAAGGFEVVFDPNVREAGPGEVLLGLGDAGKSQPGIALNQKGAGGGLASVSAYVAGAPDALVAGWRAALPGGLADVRRFVVEDLSLDTCLAALLFARRLTGEALPAPAWIDYVSEWEKGNCVDAEPAHSVACLHTALAHSYMHLGSDGRAVAPVAALLAEGFGACLDFLSAVIDANADPRSAHLPKAEPACQRAIAHFRFEEQNYHLALQHGCVCQLLLPLASGRKVLVDALIVEEEQPSALLKIFARRDAKTHTGNGFTLLALHRPGMALTGNDMVISVDPASGVTLEPLWRRLEELENQRWDGARPNSNPRPLASYQVDGKPAPGAPDQPWYDDGGRYTLIAAPKAVEMAGQRQPGTKLSWREDVIPALWSLFIPIPGPEDLGVAVSEVGDFRKAEVAWTRRGILSVSHSPTFHAWLASLSRGEAVSSPLDLPRANEFEVLAVQGGLAIAHAQGATLFDDWTHQNLEPLLAKVFDDMAQARTTYGSFLEEKVLDKALAHQKRASRKGFDPEHLRELKEHLLEHKRHLLAVSARTLSSGEPANAAAFRDILKRHWGLAASYAEVERNLDRIEEVTGSIYEELVERRKLKYRAITIGLGTAFMIKEAMEVFRPLWVPNWHEWTFEMAKGHIDPHELHHLMEKVEKIAGYEHLEMAGLAAVFALAALFYFKKQISIGEGGE